MGGLHRAGSEWDFRGRTDAEDSCFVIKLIIACAFNVHVLRKIKR